MMKHLALLTAVFTLMIGANTVFAGGKGDAGKEDGDTPTARELQEQLWQVTGRVAALKQKLLKKDREAAALYRKLRNLKKRVQTLNDRIDNVLAARSDDYRALLEKKDTIADRYRAAAKEDAGK